MDSINCGACIPNNVDCGKLAMPLESPFSMVPAAHASLAVFNAQRINIKSLSKGQSAILNKKKHVMLLIMVS